MPITSSRLPSALSAAWIRKTFSGQRATRARVNRTEHVLGLQEFIPHVTPRWHSPEHLRPLTDKLESVLDQQIELVVSVPPRHGKTETILHWIAWLLLRDPTLRIAYISYAHNFAGKQARKARKITARAGVSMGKINQLGYWDTEAGGCVQATGVRGQLTGEGFHLIIVDDPVKNRREAESATIRTSSWEGFQNDIYTRQEPANATHVGTSVIVVQTRWHKDDIAGHCIREGFEVVNLPALDPANDNALAPDMWPRETLLKIKRRVGPYAWASLYQGSPRPRGGAVFKEPTYYDPRQLPATGRVGIGVDLAYTKKTYADHSVALALMQSGANENGDPIFYVVDVESRQLEAPQFCQVLARFAKRWAGAPILWHASGTEIGSAQFIQKEVPRLRVANASADKFSRSQDVAAAWNDGRILIPGSPSDDTSTPEWVDRFVEVVCSFTGLDDPEDDEVDALASAHTALTLPVVKSFRIKGL